MADPDLDVTNMIVRKTVTEYVITKKQKKG